MDTPTIYDVSRLSGVSTATVSRTFTTPDRVRESTRRRVYAAAEALHYQPSAIARAMARQQTDKIAFLICKEGATILDEFYASICEGVMRRANGTNYQLLISTAEEWTRTAQSKQIEGVILAGNAQADLISEFQRQNIPVVLVNNRAAGFVIDPFGCCLSFDRGMVAHLVQRRGGSVIIHGDLVQNLGVGAAGADGGQLVDQMVDAGTHFFFIGFGSTAHR